MNTQFSYMYTDANNYKTSKKIILEGELTDKQKTDIQNTMTSDGFIPSQVGLDDLQADLQQYDTRDWGDDHCWHDLIEISNTTNESNFDLNANQLYDNFMQVIWDDSKPIAHLLDGKEQSSDLLVDPILAALNHVRNELRNGYSIENCDLETIDRCIEAVKNKDETALFTPEELDNLGETYFNIDNE